MCFGFTSLPGNNTQENTNKHWYGVVQNKDNKISLRPIWEEAKDPMNECAFDPEWQIKGPVNQIKHDLESNIQ